MSYRASAQRGLSLLAAATIAACSSSAPPRHTAAAPAAPPASARQQVLATEQAFAKTMADRNFNAFMRFVSSEAIFFSGSRGEHGGAEVATAGKPFFSGPTAPFSWRPDTVEVLPSGKLALSTGPIYVQGREVGRFNSIWRLESDQTWRIVFDKGEAVCPAPEP